MKILKYMLWSAVIILTIILISNHLVVSNAKGKVFDDIKKIPKNRVGLLLGTGKYLRDGRINYYYKFRINATVKLYKQGKIDFVLVSGDNSRKSYDEPSTFKEDLVKLGIPEDKIILDYAGFRTLDSVVRAKKVFGQNALTIISQKFHNERALYLAKHFKIKAIAYNATAVTGNIALKVKIREYLARVKLFIDLLFGKKPKFLGKPIKI